MKFYIMWYIKDEAKSLDTQFLAVTFKVNFTPPSVGISLGFKCFIAKELIPNQNIYSIDTIVGIYFLVLYTVHIYLKHCAAR